ncbi:hypothetical protein P3102_21235 [Amycolatopsis sp. QT-25]|uniref:hypothetical protein n=1 Tax=Amycolatopsis sp. QT-25 TaxID=3034022 RepID=UPI0023EB3E63|nr:hypothetical protein [Amycolatopsis sp. QT-25]WET76643.1 hypothetical protein P3102_21235 [Amycolatopsis sp. QT-25]
MLLWKKVAAVGAAQPPDGVSRADATTGCVEFGTPHIVANDRVNHSDRTERYSRDQWVTERYCEKDILASPSLEVARVSRR